VERDLADSEADSEAKAHELAKLRAEVERLRSEADSAEKNKRRRRRSSSDAPSRSKPSLKGTLFSLAITVAFVGFFTLVFLLFVF